MAFVCQALAVFDVGVLLPVCLFWLLTAKEPTRIPIPVPKYAKGPVTSSFDHGLY